MTLIYNAAVLRGHWSGVEWAVWQRAVELANGKSPDEFVFLVAKGVALPSPLPGGRIVRLPRFVGTRLGRIFYELLLMPRLVRSVIEPLNRSTVFSRPNREEERGNREEKREKRNRCKNLLSPISYPLSPICAAGAGAGEATDGISFFAPAYVAPPRLPCPFTLCLYDLHVFTHPQFCTWLNRLHYRWRIPGSIRRAQTIEVPSEHVRDALLERFPEAAGKTVVRHLALRERFRRPVTDAEKAAVRDKYGLPARYILFVGAPTPRKNLPAALAAWRAVRAEGEAIGFFLVGDDKAVPDQDMPALYACASVLLYPSFDEGYGLPIAEARACGCPVVTSAPTAREIAPEAFACGTDATSIANALRRALAP